MIKPEVNNEVCVTGFWKIWIKRNPYLIKMNQDKALRKLMNRDETYKFKEKVGLHGEHNK